MQCALAVLEPIAGAHGFQLIGLVCRLDWARKR
jgi:hypothetical protein